MADTRFSEYWREKEDVLVTVRARLRGSMSGWHDFAYAEPFRGEGGFSIPDSLVHDIVAAPPLPDPKWEIGDLVQAECIDENGEWSRVDYFEFRGVTPHGGTWRWLRENRDVLRQEMRNVTPIARDGRPWED